MWREKGTPCYGSVMKFLLTSSGLTSESLVHALEKLAGKAFSEMTILYISTAGNTSVDGENWLVDELLLFRERGCKKVALLDIAIPKELWAKHFTPADVVCFGGGNEKYLARVMQEQGFKEFIVPLLSDKVYMGISAGSMVAGHFLKGGLTNELFPEEDYGSEGGIPMGILDVIFVPHMNSEWFKKVRPEFLSTLKDKFDHDTYATDDETALAIDGDHIEVVGTGKSWISRV